MAVAKVFNQNRNVMIECSKISMSSEYVGMKETQIFGNEVGCIGKEVIGVYKSYARALDVLINMSTVINQKENALYFMPKE